MVTTHSEPKFSTNSDAIAFYKNERGIFPCIVIRSVWKPSGWHYRVTTGNGNHVVKAESEMLTGWEPNFPAWSEIEWGNFNPADYSDCPEWEFADHPYPDFEGEADQLRYGTDFAESWKPDEKDWSDLAEQYESA